MAPPTVIKLTAFLFVSRPYMAQRAKAARKKTLAKVANNNRRDKIKLTRRKCQRRFALPIIMKFRPINFNCNDYVYRERSQ